MTEYTTLSVDNPAMGYSVQLHDDLLQTDQQKTEAVVSLVKSVLEVLGLVGYINVAGKTHMAHALEVVQPWQKAHIEYNEDGTVNQVRLRSKHADYAHLGKEAAHAAQSEDLTATLGFLNGMTLTMGPVALMFSQVSEEFDEKSGLHPVHNLTKVA